MTQQKQVTSKQVTPKFAGIESNPKSAYGNHRVRDLGDIVWFEESWAISRTLGSSRTEPYCITREGVCAARDYTQHAWYDVRVLPDDAQTFLTDIDARILSLRKERQQYLSDHFREWCPATKDDCSRVVPRHMTKAEATQAARAAKKVGKAGVEDERKLAGALSKTISKIGRRR